MRRDLLKVATIGASLAAGRSRLEAAQPSPAQLGGFTAVSTYGVRSTNDGETNTKAMNTAIRDLAAAGGGTLVFDPSPTPYPIIGPVILPSNIMIDLNGQVLQGRRAPGDVMFVTGTFADRALRSNLTSKPETELVSGAGIHGGRIEDCTRVFHFRNFGTNCHLRDIVTRECIQVARLERCFYSTIDNVTAAGFSDPEIPTFHFVEETNAVVLHKLNAVTAFGLCIEGGAAAVLVDGCAFEGGQTAVRLIGDCMGIHFRGGYFESILGRAFDLRRAGACWIEWTANFFQHVDIVVDDGGEDATATLSGQWHASNYIVMSAAAGFAHLPSVRRQMRVAGPRNFVSYDAGCADNVAAAVPSNWIVGKHSRVRFETASAGRSLTDTRARAQVHAGVLPTVRSGDTGQPIAGTVPFTTMKATTGERAVIRIDTTIRFQPDSLFARYLLNVEDDGEKVSLYGDIYGANIVQLDKAGKTVELINVSGMISILVRSFRSVARKPVCTGSIQILT